MSPGLATLLLALLLLLSALFSGSETGVYSLSRVRLHAEVRAKHRSAQLLARLVRNDTAFLITLLVGNNLMLELLTHVFETTAIEPLDVPRWAREIVVTLLLAPVVELDETVARDVVLVLDRSGSMEGDKMAQAIDAAEYVLDNLGADDRFAIVDFSRYVRTFADELRPSADASAGIDYVRGLAAGGNVVERTELPQGLAYEIVMGVAEQGLEKWIGIDDHAAVRVQDEDAILGGLEQAPIPGLRGFQGVQGTRQSIFSNGNDLLSRAAMRLPTPAPPSQFSCRAEKALTFLI